MDETLIQDIIIDLTESQIVMVYANQYDKDSRIIRCHIQNEGVDFDCSNYVITLYVKKSNGYGLSKTIGKDSYGTVTGNIVTIPITKDMTYSHGRQSLKLELKNGNDIIHTHDFYLKVNKTDSTQDDVLDSDDYKSIHDEYEKLSERIEAITVSGIEVYTVAGEETPTTLQDGDYWTKLL